MKLPAEDAFVFNVVWTGCVFSRLEIFARSQLEQSAARFRFVANACPASEVAAMEAFSAAHPGRVVEVLEVSADRMVRHGQALDTVVQTRDDGDFFAFIDPDILARAPFVPLFAAELSSVDAVTSGKELWSDHNTRPLDHPGVNGEYFFDHDGFVFGSPHLAIYRRAPLLATLERWDVGFGSAGNDIGDAARDRLVEFGRGYWVYDTAKIVNILLQADGAVLTHREHPDLLHIGGVSHYLAPPSVAPAARDRPPVWGEGPDWGEAEGMEVRHEVARYCAEVLDAAHRGVVSPPVPANDDPSVADRLVMVRDAIQELMAGPSPNTEREAIR